MAAITENFTKHTSFFQPAIDAVSAFFDSLARACVAAEAYDHLAQMSDAQLAARGLDRTSIAQHVVTRHLGA